MNTGVYVNADAGTINHLNLQVDNMVTAVQCFDMGRECIINLLCQATTCIITNDYINILWIW